MFVRRVKILMNFFSFILFEFYIKTKTGRSGETFFLLFDLCSNKSDHETIVMTQELQSFYYYDSFHFPREFQVLRDGLRSSSSQQ